MATARSCCYNGIYCTLCCFTHGVPEIDKHPFTKCRHCMEAMGCAAHFLPPGPCSEFRCAYLSGVSANDTWPHLCKFVQEYRWTRYGHTWIMSAIEPAKLDTPLARREISWAIEHDLVVVLEKPAQTIVMFADNRAALASTLRGPAQPTIAMHASEYLGFSVSAIPYMPADLGADGWYQL